MASGDRIWKAVVAGLCGSIAHSLLMYFKSWAGLLPSFQPYDNLQMTLSHVSGTAIHAVVPWLLSFLNGSTIVGFIFGHLYRWLPGNAGAIKGMIYGVLGWAIRQPTMGDSCRRSGLVGRTRNSAISRAVTRAQFASSNDPTFRSTKAYPNSTTPPPAG